MTKSIDLQPKAYSDAQIFTTTQVFYTEPKLPKKQDYDLSNHVALVTGGTNGLGLQTSRHLLSLGLSTLIIAGRDPEKGEKVAESLREKHSEAKILFFPFDMGSYNSVQEFARRIEAELPRLDIVILGAGVMQTEFIKCEETKHESSIQINYLSTVLLAILLLPVLKSKSGSSNPGRLTIIGSSLALSARFQHRDKRPFFDAFDNTSIVPWDFGERYSDSKLFPVLWFQKLAEGKYVSEDDVIVNVADPGLIKGTSLHDTMKGAFGVVFGLLKRTVGRPLVVGAHAIVDAAVVKGRDSHESFIVGFQNHAFPLFTFTPEGKAAVDALWENTMAELEFANVDKILQSMK